MTLITREPSAYGTASNRKRQLFDMRQLGKRGARRKLALISHVRQSCPPRARTSQRVAYQRVNAIWRQTRTVLYKNTDIHVLKSRVDVSRLFYERYKEALPSTIEYVSHGRYRRTFTNERLWEGGYANVENNAHTSRCCEEDIDFP